MPFGDKRAAGVVARPDFREGLDECLDVVIIGGVGVYEVGDCGWLIWGVGDIGKEVNRF